MGEINKSPHGRIFIGPQGPKTNWLNFCFEAGLGQNNTILEKIILKETWPVFLVKNFYTSPLGGGPKLSGRNKFPITAHKIETKKNAYILIEKDFNRGNISQTKITCG